MQGSIHARTPVEDCVRSNIASLAMYFLQAARSCSAICVVMPPPTRVIPRWGEATGGRWGRTTL